MHFLCGPRTSSSDLSASLTPSFVDVYLEQSVPERKCIMLSKKKLRGDAGSQVGVPTQVSVSPHPWSWC